MVKFKKKRFADSMNRQICMLSLICLLASAQQVMAQLDVSVNKTAFMPGDSLFLKITAPTEKSRAATVFLTAVNDQGMRWEKRWPVLDGTVEPAVYIPDSMPAGHYRLNFLLLRDFFSVYGTVIKPAKVKQLKATLIAPKGELLETTIPVDASGRFEYRNVLFEQQATLFFKNANSNNNDLDINIETVLDSVFLPAVTAYKDVYIGTPKQVDSIRGSAITKRNLALAPDSVPALRAHMLEEVTIEATAASRAQQFNEKYSTGLFRDMFERIIDVSELNGQYTSILQYLPGRVAGLYIQNGGFAGSRAIWRGSPVYFYLDEMRVDIETISSIPVSDLAIIKAYPPPFMGNPGGNGGAIALYSKRGGDNRNTKNRHTFRVRGYSPLSTAFTVRPSY